VKRSLSILFALLLAGMASIVFAAPARADNGYVQIGRQSFYINGLLRSETWGAAYDYFVYPYNNIGGHLALADTRNDGLCAWARVNYYSSPSTSLHTEYFINCTPGTTNYHDLYYSVFMSNPRVRYIGVTPGVWCSCGPSLSYEELWLVRL
jgi:hypothetical protein